MTTRSTVHTCEQHAAGTRVCYVIHRCGCTPCRESAAHYERERLRRKVYESTTPGVPSSLVDGDTVRAHLRQLMDAGMGWKRIADVSGVAESTVCGILYGVHGDQPGHPDHRPARRQVRRATADKLLAVRLDLADGVPVDSTGTARRLQALVAIGWSGSRLAVRLDISRRNFTPILHGTRQTTHGLAQRVRALYDDLWDAIPPAANRWEEGGINRARNMAAALGWAPPMAWDDADIDDPTATPDLGEGQTGRGGVKRVHVDDVEWLLDSGETLDAIAHRLGVRTDTVRVACLRAERADLHDRLIASKDATGALPTAAVRTRTGRAAKAA